MKSIKKTAFILVVIIMTFCNPSIATTWDEPWHDEVVKKSDFFVLGKILSSTEKNLTIKIQKTLAGENLSGKIDISDFFCLNLGSYYAGSDELSFKTYFEKDDECYFFIKKDSAGNYCIATPTAGYAITKDGSVYATYRHSFHQALVPVDIYEKTMTAIFDNYHGKPYDSKFINNFVSTQLSLNPAGTGENEISTFFIQHVALECIYHLRLNGYYDKIVPFLHDTTNIHNRISAARALITCNSADSKNELMAIICDTAEDNFLQVICLWTLTEFNPTELKEKLMSVLETSSDKNEGFACNLMDPRVGTHFPTVKNAIKTLLAKL